jgi:hypothetical protein
VPGRALLRVRVRVVESEAGGDGLDDVARARLEALPAPRRGGIYPLPCLVVILDQ